MQFLVSGRLARFCRSHRQRIMRGGPWNATLIWCRIGRSVMHLTKRTSSMSLMLAVAVMVCARFGMRFGGRGRISPAAPSNG